MKKIAVLIRLFFTCGLLLVMIGVFLLRQEDIVTLVNTYFYHKMENITIGEKNEYYRDYDFMFIQNIEDVNPSSYQDILNIYYSVLNSGQTSFSFYCPHEYEACLEDIKKLANDRETLSNINNYVHPFNSFLHIETEYDSLGKVFIKTVKSYTTEQMALIKEKVDQIYSSLYNPNASTEDNIRIFHDYIINNAKYDSNRSDYGDTTYHSDIAYGPLFEGYAICGGYTDLMSLFLEKMKVKNYKISSNNHIWNAVQLGNTWYHLDLTWDDPVASDGLDYLEHTYFLIDTKKLLLTEQTQHQFNQNQYLEFKEAN